MQSTPAGQALAATDAQQLAQACNSLWLATLSLMTAYMQQRAPAHRYLLARRIARNFDTLSQQECFGAPTRDSFAKLGRRWQVKSDALSPNGREQPGMITWLQRLFAR
jgi:hypothetical protein